MLSILDFIPPRVSRRFFASEEKEDWVREVEGELDVWGDGYLNRHLGYRMLELVVVRVLPEMGVKGVEELLRERIGDVV